MRDAAILGGEVYLLKSERVMMTIILIILLWYLIGFFSFVYWWTRDFDFTTKELYQAMVCGFLGIITWFIGMSIHSKGETILKKRK